MKIIVNAFLVNVTILVLRNGYLALPLSPRIDRDPIVRTFEDKVVIGVDLNLLHFLALKIV